LADHPRVQNVEKVEWQESSLEYRRIALNPKWRAWIATLDHVLERNIGRVVAVGELREFVTASEKRLDEFLEVLSDANRIERLDWFCCRFHESVLFDPLEKGRHCDLCGKKVPSQNLKHTPAVRICQITVDAPKSNESTIVPEQSSRKVFISYSHDSDSHKQRVLDLAQQLLRDGMDVSLDRFVAFPPEGWPLWMLRQIDWADYVLCVFTERYNYRCLGTEKPGFGKGVAWESTIIFNALYGNPHFNTKFIPVVFEKQDENWIVRPMQGFSRYRVQSLDLRVTGGYQEVYRLITKQPEVSPTTIGAIQKLPSTTPLAAVKQNFIFSGGSPTVPTMDESELRRRLSELLPSMFELVVADMEAEGFVSEQSAPPVTRAIELVKFARSKSELEKLIKLYLEIVSPK